MSHRFELPMTFCKRIRNTSSFNHSLFAYYTYPRLPKCLNRYFIEYGALKFVVATLWSVNRLPKLCKHQSCTIQRSILSPITKILKFLSLVLVSSWVITFAERESFSFMKEIDNITKRTRYFPVIFVIRHIQQRERPPLLINITLFRAN